MDYMRLCQNVGSIQHKTRIAALEMLAVKKQREGPSGMAQQLKS